MEADNQDDSAQRQAQGHRQTVEPASGGASGAEEEGPQAEMAVKSLHLLVASAAGIPPGRSTRPAYRRNSKDAWIQAESSILGKMALHCLNVVTLR